MATIWFLFEGQMEQVGMPKLLAPVSNVARGRWRLNWSRRFDGRPDLLKKLPGFVKNTYLDDANSHVFTVMDYHPKDEHSRWQDSASMRRVVRDSVDATFRSHVHVHLAIHDIESWILASPDQLCRTLRIQPKATWQKPEKINLGSPPKREVEALFQAERRLYRPTREGCDLLAGLDRRAVYQRCSGFKDLIDDLAGLLGIDRQRLLE